MFSVGTHLCFLLLISSLAFMLMSIVNVCLFFLFKLVNLKMVLHNKSFMHRTSCS